MRRIPLLVLVILLCGAVAAGAATVTVATGLLATSTKTFTHTSCTVTGASADITIDQGHPTVVNNTSTLTMLASATAQKVVLTKFSLSSCANIANATIDSATLKLFVNSVSGTGHILKAFRIDTAGANNWSTTTTWSTKPSYSAAASGGAAPVTGAYASLDVTNDVNDVLQTSPTVLPPYTAVANNNGWVVADTGTNTTPATANGTEATSNKPQLVLNYAY